MNKRLIVIIILLLMLKLHILNAQSDTLNDIEERLVIEGIEALNQFQNNPPTEEEWNKICRELAEKYGLSFEEVISILDIF